MKLYEEQLQLLEEQMVRKEHLEAKRRELYDQKTELDKKVVRLEVEKEMEQADVERLEGRSLANFFYNVVGKMDEKLDKERQEAYAAAVKYDAAVRELAAIEADIARYTEELSVLSGCEQRYRRAMQEKMQALKDSGQPEGEEVLKLEQQLIQVQQQNREIWEAIAAGQRAKRAADAVFKNLDDAYGWGAWDLIGGGLISDLAKHGALDEAQDGIEQLQIELRRFKAELADVTVSAEMQVNVDGFLRFADYFFDGLLVDWAVLSQIGESQDKIQEIQTKISSALEKLGRMEAQRQREEESLRLSIEERVKYAQI